MTSSISTTTASDMGDFLNIEKLNFLMLYQEIQNMKAETMNHKTEIQNLKDQNQAMQMEIQNLKIMNQQQQIDNLRFQNDILKSQQNKMEDKKVKKKMNVFDESIEYLNTVCNNGQDFEEFGKFENEDIVNLRFLKKELPSQMIIEFIKNVFKNKEAEEYPIRCINLKNKEFYIFTKGKWVYYDSPQDFLKSITKYICNKIKNLDIKLKDSDYQDMADLVSATLYDRSLKKLIDFLENFCLIRIKRRIFKTEICLNKKSNDNVFSDDENQSEYSNSDEYEEQDEEKYEDKYEEEKKEILPPPPPPPPPPEKILSKKDITKPYENVIEIEEKIPNDKVILKRKTNDKKKKESKRKEDPVDEYLEKVLPDISEDFDTFLQFPVEEEIPYKDIIEKDPESEFEDFVMNKIKSFGTNNRTFHCIDKKNKIFKIKTADGWKNMEE